MRDEKAAGKKTSIPITVRQLEAVVRISEALARMEQKETVDEGHIEEALRLFTMSTLDAANSGGAGVLASLSEVERRTVLEIEATIRLELSNKSAMYLRSSNFYSLLAVETSCTVRCRPVTTRDWSTTLLASCSAEVRSRRVGPTGRCCVLLGGSARRFRYS